MGEGADGIGEGTLAKVRWPLDRVGDKMLVAFWVLMAEFNGRNFWSCIGVAE